MFLIRLILIKEVFGWRFYDQSSNSLLGFAITEPNCPELHIFMPGMHPHKCVSYALICKDVTEVLVKTEVNGTQHVCHPRFQPWGAGNPTLDKYIVHCGFVTGVSLVIELLPDGFYKFYCKYISDLQHQNCLITTYHQGIFRCYICKRPFIGDGFGCNLLKFGYDNRFTSPNERLCDGYCLQCNENKQCSQCRQGFVPRSSEDRLCSIYCYGYKDCVVSQNEFFHSADCLPEFMLLPEFILSPFRCLSITPCLSALPSSLNKYDCDKCKQGYIKKFGFGYGYENRCFQMDWNCDPSRQSMIFDYEINKEKYYYNTCTLCDLGYFYSITQKKCLQISYKSYCVLLDPNRINCMGCHQSFALQPDGTCKFRVCNPICSTCLDTNPSFCTTCDSKKNLIADNGICKCKPFYGLLDGICTLCAESYCYNCEYNDFYSCTSCKPGSNRIVVNKQLHLTLKMMIKFAFFVINLVKLALVPYFKNVLIVQKKVFQTEFQLEMFVNVKPDTLNMKLKNKHVEVLLLTNFECHARCQTCFQAADGSENQYCLTCIPGQNRVVSDTFKCDCEVSYSDFGGILEICAVCHYTCGNCFGVEATNCSQCSESSYRELTPLGECLCKQSHYDNNTDNIKCQKCHHSCLTCANSTEKDACLECPSSRTAQQSGSFFECFCTDSNTFDDGFSQQCQQCDLSCKTCYGPLSSNCLTCDKNYRQLELSYCVCPIKYYDIGELKCAECHYSCHRCFGNNAESCIMCSFDLNLRVLKGNTCKCVDGYYEEDGIAQCQKCSYKCEKCDIQPDKCLSCPLNSLRKLDPIKRCYCPEEYFDKENETICLKCHFKCKTCKGIEQNECLSCDSIQHRELKNSLCQCQPNYYEMEVQECASCSPFCYECINNSKNCTSCKDDRYLDWNTCKCKTKFHGVSISTFDFNGMLICQKCHYSCGTCMGMDEGNCISCMETENRFQIGNTCACKEGYFDTGLPTCEKCSYKCKECQKNFDRCISCQDNSLRLLVSGFNKCQCIQGYYDDGQNDVCQKCHFSCLKCNDIETKCELCLKESNRIYNNLLFSCECNIGYYDIGVENCQKCHYSCLSCNSGDSSSCISCIDVNNTKRVYYNNTCKCLFGYFDDGSSISCQKCDIQCLQCVEQSYQCLSCPQTRKIEINCKCQQGYYDIGLQLCSKCNSKCLTCETISNNCTSCDPNQFRQFNIMNKTCDCQIGYIEIDGICQQCNSSCKTCSQSINQCTSCIQFKHLKNNDCICNDGMYEQSNDKSCKLCDKTCLTCANTNTYCLSCSIDNFRQFKYGNTCECIQGYYENPINQNCEQCMSSCLTCSLVHDNCLTCDNNLNLSLINNKCLCSQSYFFDPVNHSCQQCNITCLECQSINECTQCRLSTRHLVVDLNKCLCNDGYFETNQYHCQQCHYSCNTCENINTNCLTCMSQNHRILINNKCLCLDGYYEAGIELCFKCNSLCKTCQSSASFCLTCYDIEHNRYHSGDKCLCKPGYYEQNTQICSKCSNECLTCQGSANYCTSCDTNSKRVDQSILHKCPCIIGFYQDQNFICQKCNIKCQTCINSSEQCLSCKIQQNSNRKSISDQCNCKDGYFDDGTQIQCQKCNLQCKICKINPNNCLICQNSLRVNPPTCDCIDGYYEDEQFNCQICDSKCNTCFQESSNCLTCKPGRIDKDCKCIDGYFETGQTLCQQCAFQCATCVLDNLNCKTCKGNRLQEPLCICQSGYYDDQLNKDCQKCDSTCLECNINGCLSCFANRELNEEMNCIPPPNSIWYDNTPWCSTCQVAVVNSYLSDDLSMIIIHFDFPLNSKSFNSQIQVNKCLQLFELISVQSFGQNSVCTLNPEDNKELLIYLGENSKINVGEAILFKNNSLSHINCETTIKTFIFATLQQPNYPFPPKISYLIPLHKLNPYADNQVYLQTIKNNGNRKLININWSCQVQSNEPSTMLNQFLDQINFLQEQNLLIPKLTLPSNAVLKFRIEYYNFILIQSYSEFTIYTHAGDVPQINIDVKPSYFVYETITIGVSVGTLVQSISNDSSRYQIQLIEIDRYPQKSSSSDLNTTIDSNSFEMVYTTIPRYTLSNNSTYTFQVTAINLNSNKSQNLNFTFETKMAGLFCQFNNQGIQNIRRDLNLEIYCEDFDSTNDRQSDPDINIEVACKDLSFNTSCKNEQKQMINVNKTDYFQFIKKNSISTYTVQEWTVTVTKFQQISKFTQIIVYLDDDFPQLELQFNKGYIMRKINNYEQLNFTYLIPFEKKFHLLDLSITMIYDYQIIEILQPKFISHQFKIFNSINELNLGDNINLKFAAQYTNNIMPSIKNIQLSINQPVKCSKLLINRQSDFALTDFLVATTCEQSNDSPYKYQLRQFLRESDLTDFLKGISDNSLIFYPFQTQNQFLIQAPTSVDSTTIGVLVEVIDNGGSITYTFEKIPIKSAKINCSSIKFQDLTLQNKITLLFEAINQKCDELHQQIYLDLISSQILSDKNENILKIQAIKLYKQFLIISEEIKPKNRLLNEEIPGICLDQNSSHLFITQNSTQPEVNLTKKIEDFKVNTENFNIILQYFSKMKKQCEEELEVNLYVWNEQIFQQYQNSQDCVRSLLYYLDDIYSDFSQINIKNEMIDQIIVELLRVFDKIVEETQNIIIVNDKPLAINGIEIIWKIKRRTKSLFNQQFNIQQTQEDFLIDFIQFEYIYFKKNPLRFNLNLVEILQTYFNDQTLQIYSDNYYQIKLKNFYRNRFQEYENFSSIYITQFGSYQVCQNTTKFLSEYEIICVIRTMTGKFYQCNLSRVQNNEKIEIHCVCNKFGEIFLTTSTKKIIVSDSLKQINNLEFASKSEDLLALQLSTCSFSLIFLSIFIFQLYKDKKVEQERSETEQSNLSSPNIQERKSQIYHGNFKVYIEKLKQIHQTISLFYYKDKNIEFSYRILEVLSQFNLQLALTLLECQLFNNQIFFICVFIVLNPFIILLMRIFYKIIEAIYRFKRIAALISHLLLIIVMMSPNLIIYIFYIKKYLLNYDSIQMQSEQYLVAIIYLGSILISQALIEPITIFGRILIYRSIAKSLNNMDLNPVYHLMHFFVMHSSLEEIFEEFTKI
ncbi:unnamed protein product [Paramecium pentaurelia]|uniref:EGF-like domain-containing protein n=1 Tax=Paramecium pentaurelia TaxID=43138 RepID=A0A8S1S6N6_9CILI|nr:unnamed protein product [Paramecium pentaurelia]